MRVRNMFGAVGFLALGLTSASAADLAVKAPAPYYAPPVANWSGFYAGVNVGAGWGTTETTLTSVSVLGGGGLGGVLGSLPIAQNNRSGVQGGGQIGYNYQSGWTVFGIQGDIAALDVKGTTPCLVVLSCTGKSDWLATVTGKFGGAVGEGTLVYVKGGAAWLHTKHSLVVPGVLGGGGGFGLTGASTEETSLGWTLGAGAEYAFSPNWSAFVEYNYAEFEKNNAGLDLAAGLATANLDFKNKLSIAKIGVNYRFGGVGARY